jgi:hypothetical protein
MKIIVAITNTEIIHHPVSYLKHDVSETVLCLRLQVGLTILGPIDGAIMSSGTNNKINSIHKVNTTHISNKG